MNMTATATRTITAFFNNREDAVAAVQRLQTAGIPRSDINLVEGSGSSASATSQEGGGFWETLKDLFLPDEDRHTYAEGLRRGGHLVTVRAAETHYERALDILDDEGTIDIDERAASWRNEGWSPQASQDRGGSSTSAYRAGGETRSANLRSGVSPDSSANREEVIPVTEEELRIGKRDVSHGRVRVRSYVVEKPVQEQVNLRQEHVRVERRPTDRVMTGNEDAFRERTIEAEERAEEAVIDKQARVKEEVVVKKDVDQRSETVTDKVRRTEVEVQDERGKAGRPSRRAG